MRRIAPELPAVVITCMLANALACRARGDGGEPVVAGRSAGASDDVAQDEPIAPGVPHGGDVIEVATSDDGTAALTLDEHGALRLWPALDGARPPVPVYAPAARRLALGRAGHDLLAVIQDDAHGVLLLRIGRDGRVRGRAHLPPEVSYLQVVAISGGVLARTADQAIAWFDADGQLRGRVVAEPGSQITALAVRGTRAAVLLSGAQPARTRRMRWLVLAAGGLVWGAHVELPFDVRADVLALSPGHGRIAALSLEHRPEVFDVAAAASRVEGIGGQLENAFRLGFIDEDHVVAIGSRIEWWLIARPKDPWDVTWPPQPPSMVRGGGALGQGMVVTGAGTGLALTEPTRIRYLGWRDAGSAELVVTGELVAMKRSATRIVWVDDRLEVRRELDLERDARGAMAIPVGDRHVAIQRAQLDRHRGYTVEVLEVDDTDRRLELGTFDAVQRVIYQPDARVLGVVTPGRVARFQLDVEAWTATPLPTLHTREMHQALHLFDPDRADGLVALVVGWNGRHDHSVLAEYRAPAAPTAKLERTSQRRYRDHLLGVDATGATYVHEVGPAPAVVVRRGETELARYPIAGGPSEVATARDGSRFALRSGHDIVVFEAGHGERWRVPLWEVHDVAMSFDGRRVFVRAQGGLVVLDGQTGERLVTACGWGFGLTDAPPRSRGFAAANVCDGPDSP
jgi:hypothetical protein